MNTNKKYNRMFGIIIVITLYKTWNEWGASCYNVAKLELLRVSGLNRLRYLSQSIRFLSQPLNKVSNYLLISLCCWMFYRTMMRAGWERQWIHSWKKFCVCCIFSRRTALEFIHEKMFTAITWIKVMPYHCYQMFSKFWPVVPASVVLNPNLFVCETKQWW